ncbi:hypothetical protein NA56DRAFT_712773 [Hyaloscypha hepaticicola]|uniref:Uncharacterized protein n=1 Tax=Hyaloscypha hepaticicola TaxID=2082293 RepID=A0A2J6PFA3_9HELO|nr:hypothetical protein NA56DRAFT_712773 [Hyaloscypha hepaticicola]
MSCGYKTWLSGDMATQVVRNSLFWLAFAHSFTRFEIVLPTIPSPSSCETFPTPGITAKITYLPDDFSCDAGRGKCLTGRWIAPRLPMSQFPSKSRDIHLTMITVLRMSQGADPQIDCNCFNIYDAASKSTLLASRSEEKGLQGSPLDHKGIIYAWGNLLHPSHRTPDEEQV